MHMQPGMRLANRITRGLRQVRRRGTALGLGAVALAVGGIVLLKAPGRADAPQALQPVSAPGVLSTIVTAPPGRTRVDFRGPALSGRAALAQSAIAAGATRQIFAEVKLTAASDAARAQTRTPVALAVVLDVSGSMYSGDKLEQARRAVAELVQGMNADDYVAIVKYDSAVEVVQTLVRVGDHRSRIVALARELGGGGGTLIPQALEAGSTVLDGAPPHLVRRVVLISDGQDGSGRTIEQISADVRQRARRGVAASSLGIGSDYSEQFMSAIAVAGNGNYAYLAGGSDLQAFLRRELHEAGATVVDDVVATAVLPPGWRMTRALGADAQGETGEIRLGVGPMSAGDSRTVVLELEVPAGTAGVNAGALGVRVGYRTVADAARHEIGNVALPVAVVASEALANATRDEEIWADAQATAVYADQDLALAAWQTGDVARARQLTQSNLGTLRAVARRRPSAGLSRRIAQLEGDDGAMQQMPAGSAQAEHHRRAGRSERFADMF